MICHRYTLISNTSYSLGIITYTNQEVIVLSYFVASNFDSVGNSIVTLFNIFFLNNWHLVNKVSAVISLILLPFVLTVSFNMEVVILWPPSFALYRRS